MPKSLLSLPLPCNLLFGHVQAWPSTFSGPGELSSAAPPTRPRLQFIIGWFYSGLVPCPSPSCVKAPTLPVYNHSRRTEQLPALATKVFSMGGGRRGWGAEMDGSAHLDPPRACCRKARSFRPRSLLLLTVHAGIHLQALR